MAWPIDTITPPASHLAEWNSRSPLTAGKALLGSVPFHRIAARGHPTEDRNQVMRMIPTLAALLVAAPAFASPEENARAILDAELDALLQGPVLVESVVAQNGRHEGLTQADIDTLDGRWRAETSAADRPTIAAIANSPLSELLRERVEASNGTISEILVMDAQGLNVATSSVTSDFWQGDENKFTKTFGSGPDAVFLDQVEFDESSQAWTAQISATLADPGTGEAIGAVTIGLDAESLY